MKSIQILIWVATVALIVGSGASGASAQTGVVEKVWVEYGATVKGETGILIHAKFAVNGALNVACSILAHAERTDGHSFSFNSVNYRVKDGKQVQVSTYNTYATKDGKAILISKPFTPPYDPATYPDTKLFFPNWALNLQGESPNKMKLFLSLSSNGKEFARSTVVDIGIGLGKAR